jgi:hypothetical protein
MDCTALHPRRWNCDVTGANRLQTYSSVFEPPRRILIYRCWGCGSAPDDLWQVKGKSPPSGARQPLRVILDLQRGYSTYFLSLRSCLGSLDSSIWRPSGSSGFDSRQEQDIFLYCTAFCPVLGPAPLSTQSVQAALSPGVKRQECEADSAEVKNGGVVYIYGTVLNTVTTVPLPYRRQLKIQCLLSLMTSALECVSVKHTSKIDETDYYSDIP